MTAEAVVFGRSGVDRELSVASWICVDAGILAVESIPEAAEVLFSGTGNRSIMMSAETNQDSDNLSVAANQWDWKGMRKSSRDSKIAGICGGFGEHTPVPSWMWRVLFLTALFCGGVGLVAYVILWICMPAPDARP